MTNAVPMSDMILLGIPTKHDVVANGVGYSSPDGSSEGYRLDPFGIIFSCSQDPYVPLRMRVDRGYEDETHV